MKGEAASVTGFRCDPTGRLIAIAESARPLSGTKAHPAHALFTPRGDFLLVTELMTDRITVYRVGPTGVLSLPAAHGLGRQRPVRRLLHRPVPVRRDRGPGRG